MARAPAAFALADALGRAPPTPPAPPHLRHRTCATLPAPPNLPHLTCPTPSCPHHQVGARAAADRGAGPLASVWPGGRGPAQLEADCGEVRHAREAGAARAVPRAAEAAQATRPSPASDVLRSRGLGARRSRPDEPGPAARLAVGSARRVTNRESERPVGPQRDAREGRQRKWWRLCASKCCLSLWGGGRKVGNGACINGAGVRVRRSQHRHSDTSNGTRGTVQSEQPRCSHSTSL